MFIVNSELVKQRKVGRKMNDNIHQFVRGKDVSKGNVGVLLAKKYNDGRVIITGSKANFSHGDTFNKEDGLAMATDRQFAVFNGRRNRIAISMKKDLARFVDRCQRYFRTDSIVIPELSLGKKVKESACKD